MLDRLLYIVRDKQLLVLLFTSYFNHIDELKKYLFGLFSLTNYSYILFPMWKNDVIKPILQEYSAVEEYLHPNGESPLRYKP